MMWFGDARAFVESENLGLAHGSPAKTLTFLHRRESI